MRWKRVAKIVLWLIKWFFILAILIAVEEQIIMLENKTNVMQMLVSYPIGSEEIGDLYLFYGMKFSSVKNGYSTYNPIYVKVTDMQVSALNQQLDYYAKLNSGVTFDNKDTN